jgi:hypothetical protein
MVRAHSSIKPASMVLPGKTEMVKENSPPIGANASKARRRKKTGSKQKLNWTGLGGEVDVWA